MAEYVVAFVLDKIAGNLIEEASAFLRVHDQIEWIGGELRRMQCFLQDADAKQDFDARVKNWVADIRDVAYDTDDFLDALILKAAQGGRKRGLVMFLKREVLFLNGLVFLHRADKTIKRIRTRIHEIKDSRLTYGIENIGKAGKEEAGFAAFRLQEKRRASSHVSEEDVVGLKEDIKSLELQLIRGDSRRSVISIIGMPGLGKTTLAKKVYLSCEVKRHFDCSAWVFVSQEYRAKDILYEIGKKLVGVPKPDFEKMADEEVKEVLYKFLEEKRYVLVLYDIWNCEVWDELNAAFPEGNNGSRIMITTRFKDIALHADPKSPPFEPCLLNDEDSWELFSKKVGIEWNSSCTSLPPWSEDLGKQIVKRCGGLPLAIVVLAGLLSRKDAIFSEWLKVLQSVHWQLRQDPIQCEEILALSYRELPYYLKPCFLYFGVFPEDFEISARRLMLLWMAEGFVQPRGQEPIEDVAEDYLEELIRRSIVQVAKRSHNGRIKSCRMHDLLRELSITKAKEDFFLDHVHGNLKSSVNTRARRLAIHFGVVPVTRNPPTFRSFFFFDTIERSFKEMKKFKLLRILDLEGVYMSKLDSAIGDLTHLRYLGLRGTWLKKLPPSIRYLLNLQTLDLRSTLVDPISTFIWKLKSLRHLYLSELREMVVKPPKCTEATLSNLQTLLGLCIGNESRIENALDKLTNLRELGLHGDLHLKEEALSKWISRSKNLECLKLNERYRFLGINIAALPRSISFGSHPCLHKLHLGGFLGRLLSIEEFPQNLTELSLKDSFLMEDPMPRLETLPSLRV